MKRKMGEKAVKLNEQFVLEFLCSFSLLFISIAVNCDVKAQGGRNSALGGASVAIQDEWGVFNNVAAVGKPEVVTAFSSFENRFGLAAFNSVYGGILIPCKPGILGISASSFGNSLYSESDLGIVLAHAIEAISLGLKLHYSQTSIQEYGTRGFVALDFGGLVTVNQYLSFGATISNFALTKHGKSQEKLPVIMKSGLAYRPFEKLLFLVEIEKNIDYPARFRGGVEYNIIRNVFCRTGIGTAPVFNSFGFGVLLKSLKLDYSVASYSRLGARHNISLGYTFKKRANR